MDKNRDGLTKLYNRQWTVKKITEHFAEGNQVSVAVFDIDFFNNINNKIGHKNGDDVLKRIADILSDDSRIFTARYGSDEFIIFFANCDIDFIRSYVNKLKHNRGSLAGFFGL